MSTSLPARTKALRERLVALDLLGANVAETGLLEDLRSDLASPAAELSRALDQRALLLGSGIETLEPPSLETARKRAATLLNRFTAEQKASALKKGTGWANLLKEMKTASTDVSASVMGAWKGYWQTVFTGEAPALVKGRIAFTPANNAAFKTYEQLHQTFRAEFDKLPADQSAIERVKALAARLTEKAKEFDFDVPADVKRFLEAIQSGGAKLDLLTEAVLKWLNENDAFDNYRIVPRSADGSR
ncbi:hypothetical protein ELH06_12520 [Rhizobium ruizarguesonis]|uniref:hypothetical protein n=1 Tax=Rhizobium ruizarguesonis TaxID=2081791 RepID=UPI0010320E9B|nr:hypothetical protein [Rhizobium ruizarguesonis]TBE49926.1 hypothetical protein ELH06_12520 [Rhizobium ruizarguesonis]